VKTLIIYVRSSGHDNQARIDGCSIRASCTSSPEGAARRAAEKAFREQSFNLVCEIEPTCCTRVVGRYVATATER
jgi:hypothetical protein